MILWLILSDRILSKDAYIAGEMTLNKSSAELKGISGNIIRISGNIFHISGNTILFINPDLMH